MWQVAHHLHILPEPLRAQLVEQKGEDDEQGEEQHILHEADDERVLQDVLERGGAENELEVFQSRELPGASRLVVVEGQTHIDNGPHPEDKKIDNGGRQNQVQHPILPHAAQGAPGRGSAEAVMFHGHGPPAFKK